MTRGDGWLQRDLSEALRTKSTDKLRDTFGRYVRYELTNEGWDPRDAMVNLAPVLDCARKLGLDPAEDLASIANGGPAWFKETFRTFVARTDVTLDAFGWSLIHGDDGPRYRVTL
jgi:hypothetical protein